MTGALTASFLFSARSRSFYNASRKLGITPQAVSKNIKKLEKEIGFALFEDRMGEPVLTAQGQRYMEFLIADDRRFNWTMDNAHRIDSPNERVIRVGAYSEMFLSETFYAVLKGQRDAKISCRCYEPESMKFELMQKELDLVILDRRDAEDERLTSKRFIAFPMVLAVSRPLARRVGASSAADLADMPVYVVEGILPGIGEPDGNRLFCSRFAGLGLRPENIRVVPTVEEVESCLMLERGVSVCDISSRLAVCPVFDIFPTGDTVETRLCCRRDEENDAAILSVMRELTECSDRILKEIVEAGNRTEYEPY